MKKFMLLLLILTVTDFLYPQSAEIKSRTSTNGEWISQAIIKNPEVNISFWNHYQNNENEISLALELPYIYFGPFSYKGLLSEVFSPLNNSVSSSWLLEDSLIIPDSSFETSQSRALFLGTESGGYLIINQDKSFVTGAIINTPLLSWLNLNFNYSLSQLASSEKEQWYFTQAPFRGSWISHQALGIKYQNENLDINLAALASLSSLGAISFCASLYSRLSWEQFNLSGYLGAKDADFKDPYGQSTSKAFESNFLITWALVKRFSISQGFSYELDWPEHPFALFYPMEQESHSSAQWVIYQQQKNTIQLGSDFKWKRNHSEKGPEADQYTGEVSGNLHIQNISFDLSASCLIKEKPQWQVKNQFVYKTEKWQWDFANTWNIQEIPSLEFSSQFQLKILDGSLFAKINSQKAIILSAKQSSGDDFFKSCLISLGWETKIDAAS